MMNEASDTSQKYSGALLICNLELDVNIGITELERSNTQKIFLNISVDNAIEKTNLIADKYSEVICYDKVICKIIDEIEKKEFKIIEYFAHFIMNILEKEFFKKNNITIEVWKKPIIRGLARDIKLKINNF